MVKILQDVINTRGARNQAKLEVLPGVEAGVIHFESNRRFDRRGFCVSRFRGVVSEFELGLFIIERADAPVSNRCSLEV